MRNLDSLVLPLVLIFTFFYNFFLGTSDHSNKNAMNTLRQGNSIFTNVAVDTNGIIHWEGKEDADTIPGFL
jgi:GTP-dependent phosphoenolpyruvate carboxykinase